MYLPPEIILHIFKNIPQKLLGLNKYYSTEYNIYYIDFYFQRWCIKYGIKVYEKRIKLCNKKLKNLPQCMYKLTKLEYLDLNKNRIKSLIGVCFSNNLKILYLCNNLIESIVGVSFPDTLELLHLSDNFIESLIGVSFPSSLKYLYLSNNSIKSLMGVNFPVNMKILHLSDNKIIKKEILELKERFPNCIIFFKK